ncbi:pectate lyase 1-like [Vigna radiata var. radiata]|uniref:Pectate lyase n=1 Tax=Vigna radiata var. radiata TaxID=3916 RepID=A0A1S3U3C7_VIGRR|nr:pectate lyase 1-like [Vigna radiata var. radiata]
MAFLKPQYLFLALLIFFFLSKLSFAKRSRINGLKLNVIDRCWRKNHELRGHQYQLATCSVGYAGKMINNIGNDLIHYKVTDSSDDPINPKPNTLRYGASIIQGKVWITFQRDMQIKLEKPLLISSFTTIDGRGVNVHIANNACLMIFKATNIIIHGIRVHHCKPQAPGIVMGPEGKVIPLGHVDGDAIRLVTASKIWIDHNTLYDCQDGLLDVTRGSTNVTISNNWFKNQDKVILLGHDDGYVRDKNMKVTMVYNHFGPNCNQRMPRIRHGYAHVANNFYQGWLQYAIGGSMEPSLKSEANLFVAPTIGNKEVTWRKSSDKSGGIWNFHSIRDIFENGASFNVTKGEGVKKPNYTKEQNFKVLDAKFVRLLTRSSGVLQYNKSYVY